MQLPFAATFVLPIESADIESLVAEIDIGSLPAQFFLSVVTSNGVRFRSEQLTPADATEDDEGDDTLSFALLEPAGSPVALGKKFLAALSSKSGPRLTATCGGIAEDLDGMSGKEVRPLLVARPLPKKPAQKKAVKKAPTKKR